LLVVVFVRIIARSFWWFFCLFFYGIQLFLLALGRRRSASSILSVASCCALYALGVRVLIDDSQEANLLSVPEVHIYNHESPLDVLIIQAYVRIPSITTAGLHLNRILPWFSRSAENAGHLLMNHQSVSSRVSAYRLAARSLKSRGHVLIAPNGSLLTPVTERVSASSLLLAKRFRARIIPWKFCYYNCDIPNRLNYNPVGLILTRLVSGVSTIYCKRGNSSDLGIKEYSISRQAYSEIVKRFYS
jgi:capsular polysaccharide export protein